MKARPHNLVVPTTRDELLKLHAIAESEDTSISAIVRRWIDRNYSRAFGDVAPPEVKLRKGPRAQARK